MKNGENKNKRTVRLFLVSIIRNEEKALPRLLDSVASVVDGVVLCDTGSTDGTIGVIETWSQEHADIAVHVFSDTWKNFGHNRTLSIEHAKSVIPTMEQPHTFMLFLDADMVLEHEWATRSRVRLWKEEELIRSPVWYLYQNGHGIRYHNLRIVRADVNVVCVQPTHEYYDIRLATPIPSGLFPDEPRVVHCGRGYLDERIWIRDVGDGGCKQDKFTRDIRLLTEHLETHPKDARTLFYLANSYKNIHDLPNACRFYRERIAVGGWVQEVYMSWIYLGDCHLLAGKQDMQALDAFWHATTVLPERPEAWYRCIKMARLRGAHAMAIALLDYAQKLPRTWPGECIPLFLENSIFDYLWDEETSICAFYVRDMARGRASCARLLDPSRSVPAHVRALAQQNARFYGPVREKACPSTPNPLATPPSPCSSSASC